MKFLLGIAGIIGLLCAAGTLADGTAAGGSALLVTGALALLFSVRQ